ncbi:Subtilisin-like protease [Quillaja saponaria]|uniref:Subtilisin-like protease n=1 Tax=Quillaja saponaria TaxID=32244 RepID=A0AAD7PK68_QUISA|nr:Subtilisin-like protease [Quillaja saponaria]
MKGDLVFMLFYFLFFVSFLREARAAELVEDNINNNQKNNTGVYIVYMGAADSTNGSLRNDHAHILISVLKRNQSALLHNYKHGFSGFAARLTEEDALSIAQKPGVVSVFPDPIIKLHTTRSWDFLKYQTSIKIDSKPNNSSTSSDDTVIGILDTGIWPESASFTDLDMGPIPKRWKGTCMKAQDFTPSNCNRKLIGARFYNDPEDESSEFLTPRDIIGHGTHVASTAAGSTVVGASYYGLAEGTAKGGSPGSRIAMYRVCTPFGCRGSAILSAFDDAIADGVDVLSLSLGSPAAFKPELTEDPIAIGSFHAVENGIIVVCSAGNDGPSSKTVANVAPWILTVAATTIDRDFQSNVVLGGNTVIKGEGINFSPLKQSPVYPLINAQSAVQANGDSVAARKCQLDSLDKDKVKGKIVICDSTSYSDSVEDKIEAVKNVEGLGVIAIDDLIRAVASTYGDFPATVISSKDADKILLYVNSTSEPVATILPTVTMTEYKPAPAIAYFSSRGPSYISRNIIKPDIAAPGVEILAAWMGNDTSQAPKGKDPPLFNVISGTSMSCPHVSGVAASVKSQNPTWSPSAIKSAIMTTAIQKNNLKAPITTDSGSIATPYDYGAGEMTTSGPLQPGLVYETSTTDYLNYLCYIGFNISTIKIISKTIPEGFVCPQDSSSDNITDINYPSIAISKFEGKNTKNVTRTVTNVAGDDAVYTAIVDTPSEVTVNVIPDKLQFTTNSQKQSYQVIFSLTATSLKEDLFGSITWTNGRYSVRSPFVLSSKSNV